MQYRKILFMFKENQQYILTDDVYYDDIETVGNLYQMKILTVLKRYK